MPRQIPILIAQIVLDYMTDEQLYHLLKEDETVPSERKSLYEIEWQNRILPTLFHRRSDSALGYQKQLVLAWHKNNRLDKEGLLSVLDEALKEPQLSYQHKLLYCYFISLLSTQKTALIRATIQSLEIKLQTPTTSFDSLSRLQLEVLGPEISNDLIEQALTQLSWLFTGWTEQLLLLPFHCQRYLPSIFYIYYLPILMESSLQRRAALTLLGSLGKIATDSQRDRIIEIILIAANTTLLQRRIYDCRRNTCHHGETGH
jgi:energy-converting hydrogenase Eha subunit E